MDRIAEQNISEQAGPPPPDRTKTNNEWPNIVSSYDKIRIIQMFEASLAMDPEVKIKQMKKSISECVGATQPVVRKILKDYMNSKSMILPRRQKKANESFRDSFDELSWNAIRRHVNGIWLNHEIPTLAKIHRAVSADESLPNVSSENLMKLLEDLGFRITKGTLTGGLSENNRIVLSRRNYLRNIRKYREEGRHIYYLDETLVNAGVCGVALHIGSEDGFVPGGLLCYETITKPRDCRGEISGQTFHKWMESILPLLRHNSVIVMDNAPYHSMQIDKAPTRDSQKDDIVKWLEDKGEVIDEYMFYPELLRRVKHIKYLHKKYVIDELAKAGHKTVLRLPRNHRELNPMVLAWSSVKDYVNANIDYCKPSEAKNLIIEGVDRVDADVWKDFIRCTIEEENKCWELDYIIDDLLKEDEDNNLATTNTGDTSSSEYDSDSG